MHEEAYSYLVSYVYVHLFSHLLLYTMFTILLLWLYCRDQRNTMCNIFQYTFIYQRWLLVKSDAHHLELFQKKTFMDSCQVQVEFKCLICLRHLFISCLIVSAFLNSFFLGIRSLFFFTFQWYWTKAMKPIANRS